jgi:asparagine synthase (glutamine-hydrolysing)
MCGIVGFKSHIDDFSESLIISMRDTMSYRGPDDKGLWIDHSAKVAFGHLRLRGNNWVGPI